MAGEKILIIDDNIELTSIMRIPFENVGFQVYTSSDGKEGLETAMSFQPDVVLLDLLMPEENGYEVLASLRAITTFHSSLIVSSNLSEKSDIQRALDLGADRFIHKADYTLDQIVKIVQEVLSEKNSRQPINASSESDFCFSSSPHDTTLVKALSLFFPKEIFEKFDLTKVEEEQSLTNLWLTEKNTPPYKGATSAGFSKGTPVTIRDKGNTPFCFLPLSRIWQLPNGKELTTSLEYENGNLHIVEKERISSEKSESSLSSQEETTLGDQKLKSILRHELLNIFLILRFSLEEDHLEDKNQLLQYIDLANILTQYEVFFCKQTVDFSPSETSFAEVLKNIFFSFDAEPPFLTTDITFQTDQHFFEKGVAFLLEPFLPYEHSPVIQEAEKSFFFPLQNTLYERKTLSECLVSSRTEILSLKFNLGIRILERLNMKVEIRRDGLRISYAGFKK